MAKESEERVEQWVRVPDRSTLQIVVTGTTEDESVIATVDGLDSDNNVTVKTLNTVTGKPFEMEIAKGKRYSVDILLTYQTAATAVVHAEVHTGQGEQYGEAYHKTLVGKAKSEEFVSFFLFAIRE